jgi:hypothetical protein
VVCFEGVSELAATEIEEEPLWDGQAKSSRYQDFSTSGFVTPPEFAAGDAARYQAAGQALLAAYGHGQGSCSCLPVGDACRRPADMKPDAYQRNFAARAFDVARYLLFWGVPTNVGQVVSIRTLEKQIRRLQGLRVCRVRELGGEIAQACAAEPDCRWDPSAGRRAAGAHSGPPRRTRPARRPRLATISASGPRTEPASGRALGRCGTVDLLRPSHARRYRRHAALPGHRPPIPRVVRNDLRMEPPPRAEVIDVALGSRTAPR